MKVIRPNCRVQFTAEDINFIIKILGREKSECLVQLLADEETRDLILDDEALYKAFLEQDGCLRVSNHFYFYVMVRHVLKRAGIDDRNVADYVAEVLCEFSRSDKNRCVLPGRPEGLHYFFEMVEALDNADERTRFYIRTHIGNHSLFLAGVFLERIRFRSESKGFPDVKYYEELGRTNFRMASDHRLAERYSLGPILATLADQFKTARMALNDVAQRIFFLGDPPLHLEKFFQN